MVYTALSPLVVLEVGDAIAGAMCGRYLADYGATVSAVRLPTRSHGFNPEIRDDAGRESLERRDVYLQAGKTIVDLDVSSADGRERFLELVSGADVVIDALPLGYLAEFGLGYEECKRVRPSVVYTAITPYGAEGPKSDLPASEIVVDAAGGWMYGIGSPDREPLKAPGDQAQVLAGIAAAAGTLGAVLSARAEGTGSFVDVSMQEAVTFFLMNPTTVEEYSGVIWTRDGGVSKANYPQGVMPCRDGMIGVNVMYFAEWERLCAVLGVPEWRTDPLLETPIHRVKNRHIIDAVLLPWLAERTVDELYRFAQEKKLPFAPVNGPKALLDSRQLDARQYWAEFEHPDFGRVRVPGNPFKLEGVPSQPLVAPALSQDDVRDDVRNPV